MSQQTGAACAVCGAQSLRPVENQITRKVRPKFGLTWVLLTFLCGLGLVLWLVWPRHKEVVSVDRYLQCASCGARQ